MSDGQLRKVVAYYGGATDNVYFECGHVAIMEPVSGRPYPKRRRCHNCPDGRQRTRTLDEFINADRDTHLINIVEPA